LHYLKAQIIDIISSNKGKRISHNYRMKKIKKFSKRVFQFTLIYSIILENNKNKQDKSNLCTLY